MAEVLIYNRALTTAEEEKVGRYLADKWRLTTAYPSLIRATLISFF
jgi:hypothetical protein